MYPCFCLLLLGDWNFRFEKAVWKLLRTSNVKRRLNQRQASWNDIRMFLQVYRTWPRDKWRGWTLQIGLITEKWFNHINTTLLSIIIVHVTCCYHSLQLYLHLYHLPLQIAKYNEPLSSSGSSAGCVSGRSVSGASIGVAQAAACFAHAKKSSSSSGDGGEGATPLAELLKRVEEQERLWINVCEVRTTWFSNHFWYLHIACPSFGQIFAQAMRKVLTFFTGWSR